MSGDRSLALRRFNEAEDFLHAGEMFLMIMHRFCSKFVLVTSVENPFGSQNSANLLSLLFLYNRMWHADTMS